MAYQVLARKYRPQRFSDVIGQDHVTRTLKNAIEQQRIAHGYIFSGHRGIGKTTIARILAMALNCRSFPQPTPEPCGHCESCTEVRAGNSLDVIEIDAATNRGIDEIRELREAARYRPARDRYKIYILDEAHQITDAAFNALLKTLEEPPAHIIFMMATTQPEDIPQTIRSRCQNFNFHAVRFDDIVGQLRAIAQKESIEAGDEALAVLAEAGDGSMRDALSIMDQAIACCGQKLSADAVRGLVGAIGSEVMEDLMGTVARNSSEEALRLLDKIITEGQNPAYLARQLVKFLRNAVIAKVSGAETAVLQISSDERQRVGRVAAQFSEEDLARFLQIMLRTCGELNYRQEQRFILELGVLKLVHAQRILPMEQILSQIAPEGQRSTPVAKVSASAPARVAHAPATKPAEVRSPFEADRSRKGGSSDPQMSAGAAPQMQASVAAVDPQTQDDVVKVWAAVISALQEAGAQTAADTLEGGADTVTVEANEVQVAVAVGPKTMDILFPPELLRTAAGAASSAAGRPLKLKIVPGAPRNGNTHPPSNGNGTSLARSGNGGANARGRAAEDPVVQRMREKFGAEIRTIIDYRAKN